MASPPPRKVFAHYMVGLTSNQTHHQWRSDIQLAQAAGIDGFALNIGPADSFSEEQLELAYAAADDTGFHLFISFDMGCCGGVASWSVEKVAMWINAYKGSRAQFMVDGKPFVSTFEGPGFAASWADVKAQTGPLYLVPDWTSLGPDGVAQHLDKIDGAFSWDAWTTGPARKSNQSDISYLDALSGRSYMMGVSPYFYTNLPIYSKNWLWGSDTLWYDRWEQVLDLLPEFVQIISWNDYGESHYIAPIRASSVIAPARRYVTGFPHEAWQFALPYYTAAYKAGTRNIHIANEGAVFWYRTTPKLAGSDGGTKSGPGEDEGSATEVVEDAVFVMTLANSDASVKVSIGGSGATFLVKKGVGMVKLPFNGRTGKVKVRILGKMGVGSRDIGNVALDGKVNFNVVVANTR